MQASWQHRATSERGFTLIELLVVIVIIGILLAIAVPSYLGFRDRANLKTAEANVRSGIPSAEAFSGDNNGTYVGLGNAATGSPKGISFYDSGIKATVATATATGYCLTATSGNKTVSVKGPGATAWYITADCTGTGTATPP